MCSREGFEEVVRKSSSGWHGGGKGGRCEEGWCRAPSQTVPSAGRVSGGSWYPRSWLIGRGPWRLLENNETRGEVEAHHPYPGQPPMADIQL